MSDELFASQCLAINVQNLRRVKSFSEEKLSDIADIPRSTITNIESGEGNPSLNNLCKLAAALHVSIEELLSRPRTDCALIKAKDIPVQTRSKGKVSIQKLMPDKKKGIEIDRIELNGACTMTGHPHLEGTKEYLHVVDGAVTVFIRGEKVVVEKGDVLAFSGNQPHSYKNTQSKKAVALSVVIPIPHDIWGRSKVPE